MLRWWVAASAKVRPGRARIAVFPRQGQRRFAVRRDAGGERQPARIRGRRAALAAARWRWDRASRRRCPTASVRRWLRDRPGRVLGRGSGCDRFPIRARPCGCPSQAEDMNRPELFRIGSAGPSPAQQRAAVGLVFRFDEQLAERGVRQVRRRRGEDDLGVAGHLNLARAIRIVHDRQPADFDIVLGGDDDVEPGREAVVDAMERRALRRQRHQVVRRVDAVRIRGRRPDGAGPHVAQIEKLTAEIARRIATASRDGPAPAEACAAAAVGDDREIVAVRQKGGVGERRGPGSIAADGVDGRGRGRRASLRAAAAVSSAPAAGCAPGAAARSP